GTTSLAGVVLAGVLGEVVGIMPILALQGAMYVLSGLYVIAAMPKTTATLVRPSQAQAPTDSVDPAAVGAPAQSETEATVPDRPSGQRRLAPACECGSSARAGATAPR
ncbi:MAG: hypothetical protein ACR2KL_03740, partial [Nocardioidaceae bacterium]